MNKKKYLLCMITALTILISFSILQSVQADISFNTYDEQTIALAAEGRHYGFPDICIAPNGDWIVGYQDGPRHGGGDSDAVCNISSDEGATWSSKITIYDAGGSFIGDVVFVVSSNGTIIGGLNGPEDRASIARSFDNGSTWCTYLFEPSWVHMFTGGHRIGDACYLTGSNPYNGDNASLWVSYDNGTTWQAHSYIGTENGCSSNLDEWDFINITDDHWFSVYRVHPANGTTQSAHSYDGGVTWTEWHDFTHVVGQYEDPNLNWFSQEDGVILLHGRNITVTNPASSSIWVSVDNCVTWQNYTNLCTNDLTAGCCFAKPCYDTGYTGFIKTGDREGFMVWYNGSFFTDTCGGHCDIFGKNLQYNVSGEALQFINISGGVNGTTVFTSNPIFNWSAVDGAVQYQLQISTVVDFSSTVVNIPDICQVAYPSNYWANDTVVSFTLPTEYSLTNYGTYYCRVRANT